MRQLLTGRAALAVLALFAASDIAAQSNSSALMLKGQVNATSLAAENSDTSESGLGFGLRLGWGVTKNVTLFVGIDSASIETSDPAIVDGVYGLMHVDIGGTYNFRAGKALMPYLEAGLSSRRITSLLLVDNGADMMVEGKAETTGAAFLFGGGLNYYFARTVALNLGISVLSGHFGDLKINDARVPNSDFNAVSSHASIGLTWYPIRD